MGSELSTDEASELTRHEAVIADGLDKFILVGTALLAIRDNNLHRETHDTFEDYCLERWGMGRTYAHRLMKAAEVVEDLLPIGNTPTTESQARPLTPLDSDQRRAAWTDAVATAPDGKPTAKHVTAAVARVTRPTDPARYADDSPHYEDETQEPPAGPEADPEAPEDPADPDEAPTVAEDEPEPEAVPFAAAVERGGNGSASEPASSPAFALGTAAAGTRPDRNGNSLELYINELSSLMASVNDTDPETGWGGFEAAYLQLTERSVRKVLPKLKRMAEELQSWVKRASSLSR